MSSLSAKGTSLLWGFDGMPGPGGGGLPYETDGDARRKF